MDKQKTKFDLCAYVVGGKVKYFKEYAAKTGRIVRTECVPYREFVKLLNENKKERLKK